jgi:hypothetical protein
MTIKPYIFNNYEETLPKQVRGYYKSEPASQFQKVEGLEKLEGIQLTVDLTGVVDKADVIERFYTKLGFAPRSGSPSWDALGDFLWFFQESSSAFSSIDPSVVDLRVLNLNHVWTFSEADYVTLCEILVTTTDNSRFDDGFRLILEVINIS